MLRALTLLSIAMSVASPGWAAQDAGPIDMARMIGRPSAAAEIAAAVGDCVAQDGAVARLAAIGWRPVAVTNATREMTYHRRDAGGPMLTLPVADNPLRCWVLAQPVDDKAMVVKAIDARLGVASSESRSPQWQVGNHSLAFDWFEEPGKPIMTRIEVYMFPQEKK